MHLPPILWALAGQSSFLMSPTITTAASNAQQLTSSFSFKSDPRVLTPKDVIELPRPGPAFVNRAGDLVAVAMANYSFSDKSTRWVHIAAIDGAPRSVDVSVSAPGEIFWLDERTLAQVIPSKNADGQDLYTLSVQVDGAGLNASFSAIPIGILPPGARNFVYNPDSGFLVFSAEVYGDLNPKTVKALDEAWEQRGNSAFVYDHTTVREVDAWRTSKRPSIFSTPLAKNADSWQLGEDIIPLLKASGHHAPSGGTGDFDVSATSLVYTTKDPTLPEGLHTKQNIYIIDLERPASPRELTSGEHGATSFPRFNARGDKVAWLEQPEDGYETAHTYVVVYDLTRKERRAFLEDWDRSPDSLAFSPSGGSIYITAADEARGKVFLLSLSSASRLKSPQTLASVGTASSLLPLPDGRLVFMRSSFTSPNDIFILKHTDGAGQHEQRITAFYKDALKGKHLDPGTEIHWTGGAVKERNVQGWVFTPPGFKRGEEKKWPALMMIHGGPQASWQDMWFPRYSLNVYANQGYVVFAPNPTGSTSFGQEFTDAISGDWGGAPFEDMRAGWKEFLKLYPEVDAERTGCWGASWGGYAVNWIAGHPEYNFGFKALVNMVGIFSLTSYGWTTPSAHFYNHAVGGMPWEKHSLELSEKMSPSNFVDRWSSPMLLIHGSKDYNIPETEAISAFHALQQRGIRSRLVIFPDENHWISKPGNTLKYHEEIFCWLVEFLGRAGAK
ncbi:alpha/beta-hydrolase [Exidia glandulosa HHB12029]|uniref:Dipeptidyl-peptidase V n=1 Tax=Exidia glandulosa HHB12029 TaxID=1314781 RepID=A0A165KJA4_EXIGL|nr:alpha/beta-hydrolase [Exidia glandulosa HHB12029]